MFGLNLRLVIPVVFRPTPPRYLALPFRAIEFPDRVFLLGIKWQVLPMMHLILNVETNHQ
jgi:hypothetical protein